MRISTNDLRSAYGFSALATSQPVRPLAAVDARARRDQGPSRPPAERVLEGELLRQNPVAAVETILSDARTALFARAQVIEPQSVPPPSPALSPFAVLFYQQHSSPENLAAGQAGRHVNQFV
jgi:hypothetical protein